MSTLKNTTLDEDMKIVKRDGSVAVFNKTKIRKAIISAMRDGGVYLPDIARIIANDAENYFLKSDSIPTISQVEKYVFSRLIHYGQDKTAKAYESYRAISEFRRQSNTTDDEIYEITRGKNQYWNKENSNKDSSLASTQRDYIAGSSSKDIAFRKLFPTNIIQAHMSGLLHLHDLDYAIQPIPNCCLINIGDMFENGTVINGTAVKNIKSFRVACTVMTQIIASIASGQFGGQSVNIKHLGKYLYIAEEKYRNIITKYIYNNELTEKELDSIYNVKDSLRAIRKNRDEYLKQIFIDVFTKVLLNQELVDGVQTIQYQINTISCSNGQTPFVTLFLELDDNDPYLEYTAKIIHEILRQRYEGVVNEFGVVTTPTFPKLVFVLDENNIHQDSKFRYIYDMAIKSSARRMYPDYISAKKMREMHNGQVFSPMGCRSMLSDWKDPETGAWKYEGRFNKGVVSINLPQVGLACGGDPELFWETLDQRLELCHEALLCKANLLKGTPSSISPIHWQHGGIARLGKDETIDKLLEGGYSTISLGYIGLYELTQIIMGCSHTTEDGKEFALSVLKYMKDKCNEWNEKDNLGFGLYGSPAETLCYRFAKIDRATYGIIPGVTDKEWYTNSYHVCPIEQIDAFSKIDFESAFQKYSSGGCISYVEIPNLENNLEAVDTLVQYMYDNILYCELNTRSDFCCECNFHGEVLYDQEADEWYCPQCGCRDQKKVIPTRRTCGYLGSHHWNQGKTKEIVSRVLHLD